MPQAIPSINFLSRIDFAPGQRTIRPLPPIGNWLDGRAGDTRTAHFPETKQTTVITLGGSTATGDISTLTIRMARLASGAPFGDEIGDIVISATTGATQTLAALGELIEAAAVADQLSSTLADLSNNKRLRDVVKVTAANEVITVVTRDEGARFTYVWASDGSATATDDGSSGDDDLELKVGTAVVITGYDARGVPKVAAPVAGSVATAIMGIVMEGPGCKPVNGNYDFKSYKMGSDLPVAVWGAVTAYAEGSASIDGSVYVRKTATGTEVAGALAGTATTDTPEVYTLTPTAANSTLFGVGIDLINFFTGAVVQRGRIFLTSDADATATEIVTGWKTSLADDNDQFDDLVVGTGTTTLILTVAAGYKILLYPDSPGVVAGYSTPSTAGLSDHMLWAGKKYLETTTAAGIQAVNIPQS
jgi:hypothetical protein